jgi:WD40 repeat protein
MVQTHRQHTDMVSSAAWMPASFAETYPNLQGGNEGNSWEKAEELTMPPYFSASFDKKIKMHRSGACVGTIADLDWVRFMDVDYEGSCLLTGSVSSNIYGWNTTTLKANWSIIPAHQAPPHLSDSLQGINSVNGLEWMNGSTTIFASGAGDGSIKVWDTRLLDSKSHQHSCVGSVVAHSGKLNNIQWLKDNRFLMTSGRDDVIRLLDMRMLPHSSDSSVRPLNPDWKLDRLVIQEYTGHSCSGYNIQAALYENDSRICTGSRDGKIYIYDTWSGQNIDILDGISQPTHLVVPLPDRCGPGLISSIATSCQLFVWAPTSTAENTPESDLLPVEKMDDEARLERARHEALENTFQQFGDRFLKALRTEGPNTRTFFEEDVQLAYSQHLRAALLRHGRVPLPQDPPHLDPSPSSSTSVNYNQRPEPD